MTNSIPGYQLIKKIAEGGFSEIYEGKEILGSKSVAIKILHQRHRGNKIEIKRMLKEGKISKNLKFHPNLVKTINYGIHDHIPYIVFELLEGKTLRDLLRIRKTLDNCEIVQLSLTLAKAINFLHQNGIYHCDIKPENVMINSSGMIKLIDLGFARTHLSVKFSFFKHSLDGSPNYMSPEYIRTTIPSVSSDIYALGCTLYELTTGRTPIIGGSDKEVLNKQCNKSVLAEPIIYKNPNISQETSKLIMTAIKKNPNERYKSTDEFLLDLSRNKNCNTSDLCIFVPSDWP